MTARLQLRSSVIAGMKEHLPAVGADVVAAVVAEVPSYSRAFAGPMGATIEQAVALALEGFLDRLSRHAADAPIASEAVRRGSYDLGRGEARSGRSTDALLAAYRVGMRVSWQTLSRLGVEAGLSSGQMAQFAEGVFEYMDELSAQSVAGHDDELQTTGRVRERLRERLARLLLSSAPADAVHAAAARADWAEPSVLSAVLVSPSEVRATLTALGRVGTRCLVVSEEVPELPDNLVVVLVPDGDRAVVRRALAASSVVLGPARSWLRVAESYATALRARPLAPGFIDTDDLLPSLILDADRSLRDDLRARALAPLADLRPAQREKLEETLRMWLLLQGRRDDVAAALFLHPQTVRYRMGQLRELFGDRLADPSSVLELVLALG